MKKKILFFVNALLLSSSLYVNAQVEVDYTVPSWTLYQRTVKAGAPDQSVLVSKDFPYNVNVTINGDPTKQFGATWFTNAGVTGTKLQLKEGNTTDFTGATDINAASVDVNDLMYISTGNNNNDLVAKTGFTKGETRSYVSNKVLIDNLTSNTTYSYRVGGINGAWSEAGTFTTAKANKDEFSFIYVTDTQSNDDDMFEVSRKTVAAAQYYTPGAKFLLITGDLIETSGNSNSEWEWEQWFETMKASWQKLPIVPIQGNHDTSNAYSNMFHHFNTDKLFNAAQTDNNAKTAMEGTVYSFVYGDALFMCINYEDYGKGETYFAALEAWMREQVAANAGVKWKIVAYHKTMFTGSGSHQSDSDGKIVRERMAPLFQELGINLAFQGHDHLYEVIGVLLTNNTESGNTYTHLPKAVSGQTKGEGGVREDMTGIHGGTFNVSDGVLYFLNNSAGKKKYEPRTEAQMQAVEDGLGVPGYFQMFNRFGQTGEPTFSRVSVSTDAIKIATYTVNDAGEALLFDEFSVVRRAQNDYTVPSWTLYQRALVDGTEEAEAAQLLVSKDYAYNINTTINGDPTSQIGVTWFTNAGVINTKIQVKSGNNVTDFTGAVEPNVASVAVNNLVYIANSNNNTEIANASGFEKGETRSYISNKALINGLQPNTTYSYRIGNGEVWSETGTFTTAKPGKDEFEFIYITDTQANTDEMFNVSKKTVEAAHTMLPDAKFLICTGDFVETYHIPGYEAYGYSGSAEWEWEQWFEKIQSTWLHLPIVPVQGNHDISPTHNMFHHFNTDKSYNTSQSNPAAKTNMDGTVYSFVYGDALFMVINFENIPLPYVASSDNDTYINAIADWLRAEATAHTDVKWKIAAYHKSMFTGSASHQDDQDGRFAREKIAPVLQELGVDLALQGHDHIYEVIGVLTAVNNNNNITYTHLPEAVRDQELVTPTPADGTAACVPTTSVTGKDGGTYDVSEGVLYFLNNSAGQKKYYPRSEEQMNATFNQHGVPNYFTMFNKFGQTGEPTFSSVKVSTEAISIATYTVNNAGTPTLFDEFKVVKNSETGTKKVVSQSDKLTIYPNPASSSITIEISEEIENIRVFSMTGQEVISQKNSNIVDLSNVGNGIYLLSVKTNEGIYTEQFVVKK